MRVNAEGTRHLREALLRAGAKAERLLGFRPRGELEDSIRRGARWYREQGWL